MCRRRDVAQGEASSAGTRPGAPCFVSRMVCAASSALLIASFAACAMATPTCRTAFNQLAALSELHACNCWQLFNNHPVELEKIPKKVKLVGAPKDLSLKLLLDA